MFQEVLHGRQLQNSGRVRGPALQGPRRQRPHARRQVAVRRQLQHVLLQRYNRQ